MCRTWDVSRLTISHLKRAFWFSNSCRGVCRFRGNVTCFDPCVCAGGAGSLVLPGDKGQARAQPRHQSPTGRGFPPCVCGYPALEPRCAPSSWGRLAGGKGTVKLPVPPWEEGPRCSSPGHSIYAFKQNKEWDLMKRI